MFKRNNAAKVISLLLLLGFFILVFNACEKKPEVYKIGAILPLTGKAAIYGQWIQQGMTLALEEVNPQEGTKGRKIEIIYEDSGGGPKDAVTAINKLMTVDKVRIVFSTGSSMTAAIAPIAESNNILLFTNAPGDPDLTKGDLAFRNITTSSAESPAIAKYAYQTLGVRKVAIFHMNNAGGLGFRNDFARVFEELGGTVLGTDTYEIGSTDFKGQLTKLQNLNPDAIFFAGWRQEIGIILKQLKELEIHAALLGCAGTFEEPGVAEMVKELAKTEKVFFTTTALGLDAANPTYQKFKEKYKEKYNQYPEVFAATAYDAIKLIADGAKKEGYDALKIANYLKNVKDYPGATGVTTFLPSGEVLQPVAVKTVKNGEFVVETVVKPE